MQVKRASAWLVARRVPPKQRCGIWWARAPPRSPSSLPAWEPALRPGALVGPSPGSRPCGLVRSGFGWLLSTGDWSWKEGGEEEEL